jgi:hypothetical protein
MQKITLKIESLYDTKTISLEDEVSIGRTDRADIVLEDVGLSSINTTIFRDGNEVLIVDEGSTNGTFINGSRVGKTPKILFDGDVITCGSDTKIRVSFGGKDVLDSEIVEESRHPRKKSQKSTSDAPKTVRNYKPEMPLKPEKEKPWILLVAAGSTFLIIFIAIIGILVTNYFDQEETVENRRLGPVAKPNKKEVIPLQVIDPLGGQDQKGLDELTQYWEVQEEEIKAEDIETITGDTNEAATSEAFNLNVSLDYWKKQYDRTREKLYGNDPTGRILRPELCCGVPKQTAKISEMQREGYKIPLDFADLARKRMSGELIELPMATEYWVLDVGGSSNTAEFTTFDFDSGVQTAKPGSDDYNTLAQLASNFSGVKYDMNNPTHRRQMKIRLLRMFHPSAKPILERLAKAYHAKYDRPLRITSLARSMEYQIGLNKFNPNSFRVRGAGSLPPHTSGCAFDLSRKFQSADEQNFMVTMLADMEKNERNLDALREGNVNACFHVFIYDDGQPPVGF